MRISGALSLLGGVLLLAAGCSDRAASAAPEKVSAVASKTMPGTGIAGRFHAELGLKSGRLDVFRLFDGDLIRRDAPMATAVNYDYGGTATQNNDCDALLDNPDPTVPNCGTLDDVVNLYTDQSRVTYVEGGVCYRNGQVFAGDPTCNGLYPDADHPCRGERMFCGPIRIVSYYDFGLVRGGLPNVVIDMGTTTPGAVETCRDTDAGDFGTCEATGGNNPAKVAEATSNLEPSIPAGEGPNDTSCTLCYANYNATAASRQGLRNVLVSGVSSILGPLYTDIAAIKIADDFDTNQSIEITFNVVYGLPAFDAPGAQIELVDDNTRAPLTCFTPPAAAGGDNELETRAILHGASFGPEAACLSTGVPGAGCDDQPGTPHTSYQLRFAGQAATSTADDWADTVVLSNVIPNNTYGCGIEVVTPVGNATTDDDLVVCPDVWRSWPSSIAYEGRAAGAGAVLGTDLVTVGGRAALSADSGTNTVQAHPLPRCANATPVASDVTASATPPAALGKWGMAHAEVNDQLYVFGGSNQAGTGCVATVASLSWNGSSGSWTTRAPLPTALCQATAVPLVDRTNGRSYVVVSGGLTGAPFPNTSGTPVIATGSFVYDVASNTWASFAAGFARYNAGAAGLGTNGIVVGGSAVLTGNGTANSAVRHVSVSNGVPTFASGPTMPAVKNTPGVVGLDGNFYVHGGSANAAFATSGSNTLFRIAASVTGQTWVTLRPTVGQPRRQTGHVLVVADFNEPVHDDLERLLGAMGIAQASTFTNSYNEYNP